MVIKLNDNKSIWEDYLKDKKTNELNKDLVVDVLVIGGGICGVLNAYYLTQAGFNVVLLEKNKLGSGVTKNTTAFITAQQDILYQERLKKVSSKDVVKYIKANYEAIEEYKKLSGKFYFDFESVSSNMYSLTEKQKLKEEYEFLKRMDLDISFSEGKYNVLTYHNQAQMNPIKLINELSNYFLYFENTEVIDINDGYAYTIDHRIKAKKIIICTHFPAYKIKGLFSLKMYQKKSYVVSFESDLNIRDMYTNIKSNGFYLRKYNDVLIVGGNDIKTGCVNEQFDNIIEFVNNLDSNAKVLDKWTNQDCITLDDMPYVGWLEKNLYVCTGFNMWGMTSAMISALLIRDILLKVDNEYLELFSPHRKMYKNQLIKNVGNSLKSLLKFGKNRCNHLGCKLNYIALDDTYECPCHGSKYNKNGEIINSPAKKKHKPF